MSPDATEAGLPLAKRIGGQNLEGKYFIISVPDGWTEKDPYPEPSPADQWFDRLSDFKAALDCPWLHVPVRFAQWKPPVPARTPT